MTSFVEFCDELGARLQQYVPDLADAVLHLYAPWSTEELFSDSTGERHLAIWPVAEPDVTEPLTVGLPAADVLSQTYAILVWEDASAEASRRADDAAANRAWLDLAEEVRDALYDLGDTFTGGGVFAVRYQGMTFPDVLGSSRWVALRLLVRQTHDRA